MITLSYHLRLADGSYEEVPMGIFEVSEANRKAKSDFMAKITKVEQKIPTIETKKKVAAYARISMESERMNHSLSAQISHYNALIQKNPEWEFAGVYADDGISGTGIAKRSKFQRMVADCEAGKIDIVLTKSIQRFARNTVDLLETVRHLKDIGVENARIAQHQSEYQKRYDGLVQYYDEVKVRYDEVAAVISEKEAKNERLASFIRELKSREGTISEFDLSLWSSMVEFVTVGREKEITVTFRDGTEILA